MTLHYFVSDLHFGARGDAERRERFCRFLNGIKGRATSLFILGDLFEFGFEYRHDRLGVDTGVAAKLAELAAAGCRVVLVKGNHDCWLGSKFHQQYGVEVFNSPLEIELDGKRAYLAHGDELDGSVRNRVSRFLFRSRAATWCYSLLPEALGVSLAHAIAGRSRISGFNPDLVAGFERFAARQLELGFDIVVLAHIHSPVLKPIGSGYYFNSGDWLTHYSYGLLTNSVLSLEYYSEQ